MPRANKVAISLPGKLLDAVERARQDSGESRSEFFRQAAEELLHRRSVKELSEQYVRAYRQTPESEDEVAAARRAANSILATEPWE